MHLECKLKYFNFLKNIIIYELETEKSSIIFTLENYLKHIISQIKIYR